MGAGVALKVALIPAVGLAAQGIAALGVGVASLLPNLSSFLALVADRSAPGSLGMGVAMATVKLATNDLSKALSGNKEALKGPDAGGARVRPHAEAVHAADERPAARGAARSVPGPGPGAATNRAGRAGRAVGAAQHGRDARRDRGERGAVRDAPRVPAPTSRCWPGRAARCFSAARAC
jgi:hypothetical protein